MAVVREMKQPKVARRQNEQYAAQPGDRVIDSPRGKGRAMDGFVQRTEKKCEDRAVQYDGGRNPQRTATDPDHESRCAEQQEVHGELRKAARVRALRQAPQRFAVNPPSRYRINVHHAAVALILKCYPVGHSAAASPPRMG